MKLPPVLDAVFRERINRYLALVELNGEPVEVFLPNPGRLSELLVHNANALLHEVKGERRKTRYDFIAVFHEGILVSIDSRLPNVFIAEALAQESIPELKGYRRVMREPRIEGGRLDFLLDDRCLVEVKSCTLVREGTALFPDAPTVRGSRHLKELASSVRKGMRGVVFFLVQRADAEQFRPNDDTDPLFGKMLREAMSAGVEALAYSTVVSREKVVLGKRIPMKL